MINVNFNPVIINFGPIAIRWYSLAYVLGILFASWYIKRIDNYRIITSNQHESLLFWSILGIILGGRIGYILLYNPTFYMQYPTEILQIWHGGMSFHGGVIGLIISIIVLCKSSNLPILYVLDLASCASPLGIFLGRIANFINGELYGRVTEVPWGVIFSTSNNLLPRHPSQIYEALLEGLFLFILLNYLLIYTKILQYRGMISGFFIIFYSILRFIIEFFREPDNQIGYVIFNILTMGQVLSVITILAGFYLLIYSIRNTDSIKYKNHELKN